MFPIPKLALNGAAPLSIGEFAVTLA